jgi:hypothetical protein
MRSEPKWWESTDNVLLLARQLNDDGEWDTELGIRNILRFFEKPWNYDEWKLRNEKSDEKKEEERPV